MVRSWLLTPTLAVEDGQYANGNGGGRNDGGGSGAGGGGSSSILAAVVSFNMRNNRWCCNVGRAHRNNGVFYCVDLRTGSWCQRCYDPDCCKWVLFV